MGGVEFFEYNCNKFTAANGGAAGLKKVGCGRSAAEALNPKQRSGNATRGTAAMRGAAGQNRGMAQSESAPPDWAIAWVGSRRRL